MRQPTSTAITRQPDAVSLAATTWLASGVVLLGLTPLPWRDATFGWSPAFWLLAAPTVLLVAKFVCTRRVAAGESSYGRRARSRAVVRRSGGYTPAHERGERHRRAGWRAQQAMRLR